MRRSLCYYGDERVDTFLPYLFSGAQRRYLISGPPRRHRKPGEDGERVLAVIGHRGRKHQRGPDPLVERSVAGGRAPDADVRLEHGRRVRHLRVQVERLAGRQNLEHVFEQRTGDLRRVGDGVAGYAAHGFPRQTRDWWLVTGKDGVRARKVTALAVTYLVAVSSCREGH